MLRLTQWLESVEKKIETASALLTTAMEDDDKSLGLTYVTDRIVAMGFPPTTGTPVKHVDPRLPTYLKKRHGQDRYMVWNLSEVSYEGLSAVEFKFPGHPSAPLGALFELCTSLDSWLQADSQNVAVVHCLTGKGRTITVLACYLAWIGYKGFTPQQAMGFVCERKMMGLMEATIPSQRRYVEYFSRALDGVRPRSEPIVLRCARAYGVPKGSLLQAYVDGTLAFTGKASSEDAEGVVSFKDVNATLDGDVLMRIRYEDEVSKTRISIFRVAIHSGYTPSGTFRLERGDLDGGSPEAWMEIEFDPVMTQNTAVSPMKIAKGVATSESAFWEMIAKRRVEIRNRELESGNAAFSIQATPAKGGNSGNLMATGDDAAFGSGSNDHDHVEHEEEEHEDELEKELGKLLDGGSSNFLRKAPPLPIGSVVLKSPNGSSTSLVTPSKGDSAKPSATPEPASTEDDNFEELEQYLKQLDT